MAPAAQEHAVAVMPDEIHVWSLALDAVADTDWPALERVLDDMERARLLRLRFERDRRPFVGAHALLRHMLAHFCGHGPDTWRFAAGEHGKPCVVHPSPDLSMSFSLTHADRMVAAAVTTAGDVGVDIESLDRVPTDLAFADPHLAPEERRLLHGLPFAEQGERFIRLWTLKEAFVKATGIGLDQPLDRIAFPSLDPERMVFHDPALGDAARWTFHQRRIGRHVLSVGVGRPSSGAPRFLHRAVTTPVLLARRPPSNR